ncbi:MAG TPA: 50S ribosomal protein L23 [Candidatus Saccharimonadales bacterium]|nr:50S ribosomal protein L23 [Candidatus Saccharimonadales bacterium]
MSTRPFYQTVIGPVVTEKTTGLQEKHRTLCFMVAANANKIEIKRAVEGLFSVKVQAVRTIQVPGKFKRQGQTAGYASNWKKAYVTLREGEKMIQYFEGT